MEVEGDTRNRNKLDVDVSIFRQFRRLSDEEPKWILPRLTTCTSSSDDVRMGSSGDEGMDVSSANKEVQKRKMDVSVIRHGQREKRKMDTVVTDKTNMVKLCDNDNVVQRMSDRFLET